MRSRVLAFVALLCASCGPDDTVSVADGDAPLDAAFDAPPDRAPPPDRPFVDVGRFDSGAPLAVDDAVVVSVTWPDRLACGTSGAATIIVRNTGSSTWTRAGGYKLAAGDDSDPLHPGDARIVLLDGESIPTGATHAFTVALQGPATPGTYTTDWQMVREGVHRFGGVTSHPVVVACASPDAGAVDAGAPPTPDAGVPNTFNLAEATVLNSAADVASWPATATITRLDLNRDGVYIDFTRRDGAGSWPDVPFITPGEDLQYTLWIVLQVGGRLYTSGCIQYWRGLDRNGGPPSGYAMNWYYDPNRWAPMTGHQPAVGERVGFFVTAGNARNVTDGSGTVVRERSNVVVVPFPTDDGAVFTY